MSLRTTVDGIRISRPRPRTVLVFLVAVFVALAVLDVLGASRGRFTQRLVSLDHEATIGTWWASTQLLALAGLLFLLAKRESAAGRRASTLAASLAAGVSVFLSLDETAGIHEVLSQRFGVGSSIGSLPRDPDLWLVLYAIAAFVVIVIAIPGIVSFIRSDRGDATRFGVGAAMLVFGGVVVEQLRTTRYPSVWDVIFEESFEFLGVAVMVWAVYRMLWDLPVEVATGSEPPLSGAG